MSHGYIAREKKPKMTQRRRQRHKYCTKERGDEKGEEGEGVFTQSLQSLYTTKPELRGRSEKQDFFLSPFHRQHLVMRLVPVRV